MPQIFKDVMHGNAGEVLKFSNSGGDLNSRFKGYDDSPLITFAPDRTMSSLLIYLGADPNLKSKSGVTALMHSGRLGDLEQAIFLVEKGLDIYAADADGRHVLHFAIGNMNTKYLAWLLKAGAKPNVATNEGTTPLMEAMAYPDLDSIKLLLQYGADPMMNDKEGKSAINYMESRRDYIEKETYAAAQKLLKEANKMRRWRRRGSRLIKLGVYTGAAIPITFTQEIEELITLG
jgi:ankyrin repeat protein